MAAKRGWLPSSLPEWLTQSAYREMILPRLAEITVSTLARTMNVTEPYAAEVRKGKHVPHPMHWERLAQLLGVRDECGQEATGMSNSRRQPQSVNAECYTRVPRFKRSFTAEFGILLRIDNGVDIKYVGLSHRHHKQRLDLAGEDSH
jgi:hypothetical protein